MNQRWITPPGTLEQTEGHVLSVARNRVWDGSSSADGQKSSNIYKYEAIWCLLFDNMKLFDANYLIISSYLMLIIWCSLWCYCIILYFFVAVEHGQGFAQMDPDLERPLHPLGEKNTPKVNTITDTNTTFNLKMPSLWFQGAWGTSLKGPKNNDRQVSPGCCRYTNDVSSLFPL